MAPIDAIEILMKCYPATSWLPPLPPFTPINVCDIFYFSEKLPEIAGNSVSYLFNSCSIDKL